jgi:outer membrane lipoprotein SlyB
MIFLDPGRRNSEMKEGSRIFNSTTKGKQNIMLKTTSKLHTGIVLLSILVSAQLLTSCQPTSQGGNTFTASQAQTAMRSFDGIIIHLAQVQIQHNETGAGAVVGGVAGGVVGSTIGSNRGNTLATVGGALAGAAIGSGVERSRATRPAWEIEVQLANGDVVVVVQEQDAVFAVGDHVRVIEGRDGSLRVRQ